MWTRPCLLSLALILTACENAEEVQVDDTDPPMSVPPTNDTPPAPPTGNNNRAPTIATTTISGHEKVPLSGTIRATDDDGDTITFDLLDGPKWMNIGPAGEVSGHPLSTSVGTFDIIVEASDGVAASTSEIKVEIAYDPVEQALRTGDYQIILDETELTIFEAMKEDFDRTRQQNNSDIATLYELSANGEAQPDSPTNLTLAISRQGSLIAPAFGSGAPLVLANTDRDGEALEPPVAVAAIGRYEQTRFGVLGENPFRLAALDEQAVSADMHQLLENQMAWLIGADPGDGIQIVIANLPQTNTHPDQTSTRDWLTNTFGDAVDFNAAGDCDGEALWSCITDDTSLLILSQHAPSTDTPGELIDHLQWALEDGVPVLYLTGLGQPNAVGAEILNLLNVSYVRRNNVDYSVTGTAPLDQLIDWQPETSAAFEELVDRVEQNNANYALSECTNHWTCPTVADFVAEVVVPLRALRDALDDLMDRDAGAFPANGDLRWQGFALLLGDHYRSMTTYPMSKLDTPSRDFVRAMIGDAATVIARDINPGADLGTLNPSEFPEHLRTNSSVSLTPMRPFRTTGVYAFPGKTVTVTRTDETDLRVRLKVHSIRDNGGAPFRDTYARPLFMSSRLFDIAPGETRTFTSAFGGPIHAFFETSDEDITLEFENVGEHPVWRGPEDSTEFENALQSSDYNWAEFVTPYFEVHSVRDKMSLTLGREYADTPSDLADMIDTYIRDWPHWLAGREGPGISENPDLRAFAAQHGLTIPTVNAVKHMNADRASCTTNSPTCSGTSGNPYDANWSFDPIYLGDLHELGHGLEFRSRHHFEGGDSTHSTTNLYAFHTQYRYFSETGERNFMCWPLPHQTLYSTIQISRSRSDPAQYMRDENLSSSTAQLTIFVQLFAALENQGALDDGWQMMPRLNLVTREFLNSNNDDRWAEKADGLGFGDMSRETAFSLSQNDWLLIALSWSAQRDLRDYLDMWGYVYTDTALDQVARLNLPSLQPAYYAIGTREHCFGFDFPELPIDGQTSWPSGSSLSKVAAFTPDYVQFSSHEHDSFCSLGDQLDPTN